MPTKTGTPTYLERLPQVQRTFQLHKDRVEIDARWTLGKRYQTVVRLSDLSPQPSRFTVRNKWFKRSVLVGSVAIALALLLSREPLFPGASWATLLCWSLAGVSVVVAIRSFRKRQFAHFPRKDGRPGLDICKTDPDRFEAFLLEVQARIRKA